MVTDDNIETIKKNMEYLDTQYVKVQEIVDNITGSITKDLDRLMGTVERNLEKIENEYKENKVISTFDEHLLEIYIMKLPYLMYVIGNKLDDLILDHAFSEINYQSTYDVFIIGEEGTIPEKEAKARKQALAQKYVEVIKKQVYKKIDRKLKNADKLFDGVRKILSNRMEDKKVERYESGSDKYL